MDSVLTYQQALTVEQTFRAHLYDDTKNSELLQPHYDLLNYIKADVSVEASADVLLFNSNSIKLVDPNAALISLTSDPILWVISAHNNALVAGGRIFAAVTKSDIAGSRYDDVDVFFHSCTSENALQAIDEIVSKLRGIDDLDRATVEAHCLKSGFATDKISGTYVRENGKYRAVNLDIQPYSEVIRSQNAITLQRFCKYDVDIGNEIYAELRVPVFKVQFILRLYKTPSEILHTFDVDSCCLGYDGKDIWLTPRCMFALKAGYNTVNLDLSSPSYTSRLLKYAYRGMKIDITPVLPKYPIDKAKRTINNWALSYIFCAKLESAEKVKPPAPVQSSERSSFVPPPVGIPLSDVTSIRTNLDAEHTADFRAALTSLLPPLSGLIELLVSDVAWTLGHRKPLTKPVSDYGNVEADYKGWYRPSTIMHHRVAKLAELPANLRRELLWVYDRNFKVSQPITARNVQAVIRFLVDTLPRDFTTQIMLIHQVELVRLTENSETDSDDGRAKVQNIVKHTSENLRLHDLKNDWNADDMRMFISNDRVVFIKIQAEEFRTRKTIPEKVYLAMSQVIKLDVSREIEWEVTRPGSQATSTFNPYDSQQQQAWLDLNRLN